MLNYSKTTDKIYYEYIYYYLDGSINKFLIERDHVMDDNIIDDSNIITRVHNWNDPEYHYHEIVTPEIFREFIKTFSDWLITMQSYENEQYIIDRLNKTYHFRLSYPVDSEWNWVCGYNITGYDNRKFIIYGYGQTKEEALQRVVKVFSLFKDRCKQEIVIS